MAIVKAIADFFRGASNASDKLDKYGLLAPIIATVDYVNATKRLLGVAMNNDKFVAKLANYHSNVTPLEAKAQEAYKSFLRCLTGNYHAEEARRPLSGILMSLDNITGNLEQIEDNFGTLFNTGSAEAIDEEVLRTSSLVILGYVELVNEYTNWLSQLSSHIFETDALVPPFWTKSMLENAARVGDFANNNLNRWNPKSHGLIEMVKDIQRKGADVAIRTGDHWIDEFVHDSQFSPAQQDLMTASLRNPVLWYIDGKIARHTKKTELYSQRKEWLLSKVAFEEAKLAGMDPNSPEYKRLQKAVDHYADLVSKYEQKLERLRA